MRISSRCILFKDNKVLLIYREKDNRCYYVFPGGGIEDNETKEACIVRECKEELGIDVKIKKYVYKVTGHSFLQHFFLCEWVSGKLGTGNKEEYDPNRKGGLQIPMFIEIGKLEELNIVSKKIVNQLLKDIKAYGMELDNHTRKIVE